MNKILLLLSMIGVSCLDKPTIERSQNNLTTSPWEIHTIANLLETADGVAFSDLDGDGYEDMMVSWIEDKSITSHYHPGASVSSLSHNWHSDRIYRGSGQNEDIHIAHLDSDNIVDYVWAERNPGRVYANLSVSWTAAMKFSDQDQWNRVTSFDVTGDGRNDIVAGGFNRISYWIQPVGNKSPGAWSYFQLTPARWVLSLWPEDIDGDGDQDLWFTARHAGTGGQYGLYQATNPGPGIYTQWQILAVADRISESIGALIACRGDIDADGDEDIIVPWEDGEVTWYERPSWTEHDLVEGWPVGSSVVAKGCAVGDLDGDNLPELVVTTWLHPDNINIWMLRGGIWYPMHDPGRVLKTDEPFLKDIDYDGDLDILVCEATAKAGVIWLENPW